MEYPISYGGNFVFLSYEIERIRAAISKRAHKTKEFDDRSLISGMSAFSLVAQTFNHKRNHLIITSSYNLLFGVLIWFGNEHVCFFFNEHSSEYYQFFKMLPLDLVFLLSRILSKFGFF